jgi:hypothetical protein
LRRNLNSTFGSDPRYRANALFLKQVKIHQGLLIAVAIPNTETRQALKDAMTENNLHKAASVDALFDELGE